MPTYQSRASRQAISFALQFTGEDGESMQGICENLSESGLLALFEAPLDIWIRGKVDLAFGTGLLGVQVRVARLDGLRAGLAFQNMDDHRRQKIRELMAAAGETGFLPNQL